MKPLPTPQLLLLPLLLLLLLLSAAADSASNDADISRCPLHQQFFQKILGYRPDFQLIGDTHELYPATTTTSTSTSTTTALPPNGNDINATTTVFSLDGRTAPRRDAINVPCWQRCKEDAECAGYVLFLNVSQCFGVTQRNRSSRFYTPLLSAGLLLDSNAVYFEKICVSNVPSDCRNKLWLFTKIPGSALVQPTAGKPLAVLVTRARCAEACMTESKTVCLSATFVASHRNNLVRSEPNAALLDAAHELGTCTLSVADKSTLPGAFRVSTADEEYIENQCAARVAAAADSESCAYESYPRSRLSYADVEYTNVAKGECTARCAAETRFHCQGVSFGWYGGSSRCLLHSEDVISLGPRALLSDADFVYERRVKCLNVSVMCSRTLMIIRYNPADGFNGRVYVNGHSDECSSKGTEDKAAILRIAIGNEERERRCGVLRAYQIEADTHTNRTLLSALVVVQQNPIVQTQADRLVKVGCIIDNHVHDDGHIDDISLASTLGFAPPTGRPSNEGSPLFNTTGTAPRVAMRIVDLASARGGGSSGANSTTTDVALGQNLELQITLKPMDSVYDIRATNLIARSDTGHSSILLLDPQGCATDLSVFPAMQRRTDAAAGVRMLYARFHAFKFAGSGYVNFEVAVRFCRHECEPPQCGKSKSRRKRSALADDIRYGEPVKVIAGGVDRQRPVHVYKAVSANGEDVHQRNITEREQIRVDSNEVISQRVLGSIANEIVAADVRQHSRKDGPATRVLASGVPPLEEVPLRLQLSVRVPDAAANSESLIYGENKGGEQIVVAGTAAVEAGYTCVNRTFVILMLVLWLVLQAVLIAVCSVVIRRYKRLADASEEDQRALQKAMMTENFGFGEASRRVRWADQGRSRVLMYT